MRLSPGVLLTMCAACTGGGPTVRVDVSDAAPSPVEDAPGPPLDAATPPVAGECATGLRDCLNRSAVECVDGQWVTREHCQAPRLHCSAGRCIECLRGEVSCDGTTTVVRCDEGGAWRAAATCSGSLPVCLDGRCVECLPGHHLCDGPEPIHCLPDGTYAAQSPCAQATRCSFGECVPDQPPTVRILEPADGALFRVLQANHANVDIVVRGEALDAEDKGLSGGHLTWSTDRRDLQETADYLSRGTDTRVALWVPEPCQEARHRLTLTALDSAMNRGSATITVVVGCHPEP